MSRGSRFSRFNASVWKSLDPAVGPVEDGTVQRCQDGFCDEAAVYRVPWHVCGGDVAYCSYHLARYRAQHPEFWAHIQDSVDDDLTEYATRGNRFVGLDEVPETICSCRYRAVALLANGHALFERTEPDGDGYVDYLEVDRRLDEQDAKRVPSDLCGQLLQWVDHHVGVHEWVPAVREALYEGGDGR